MYQLTLMLTETSRGMKKLLLSLLAFALIFIGGIAVVKARSAPAYAADCDANAIVWCGTKNQTALKDAYKTNTTKDLPAVYSHYGISANMVNNQTAKVGSVTKSGDVILNGKVIATGARSVGRHNIAGSTKVVIAGKTYYERSTSVSFVANSIPALIFTDANGKFIAAVLESCGNPVKATPKPVPVVLCTGLTVAAVGREDFTFKAGASVTDATFKYITYTVKDKNGKVVGKPIVATNQNAVKFNQKTAGTFSVEAVVTAVAAGKTINTAVGKCKASFTVKEAPAYRCDGFTVNSAADNKFTFTVKPFVSGGATLKSVTYMVKDSSGKVVGQPIVATNATPYTYTQNQPGNYTVATTLKFMAEGTERSVTDAKCVGNFSVAAQPEYVCNSLTATQNGDRTQFVFTPKVTLKAATLKSVVYTVKNSQGAVVGQPITATDLKPVSYAQTAEGSYTVTAVVTVTVNGQEKIANGTCVANFEVKPVPAQPKFECSSFTGAIVEGKQNTYSFKLVYVAEGGATLAKAMVNYGDQTGDQEVNADNLVNFEHTFAQAGTYKIVATLTFNVAGETTTTQTVTCATNVTIPETPVMCTVPGKEDKPANSPECFTPCEHNDQLPANSPQCKPTEEQPQVLVNTGPGDIAGMFAAVTIAGTIAHRFVWSRRYNG